jgi:hypothetical protein
LTGQAQEKRFIAIGSVQEVTTSGYEIKPFLPEDEREVQYHFQVQVKFSQEYVSFERVDYNILAFLGDTGALFDVLLKIGATFLGFTGLLNMTLTIYLLQNIYKPARYQNTVLLRFFSFIFCDLCRQNKIKHQNRIGLRRIDREIDILQFVKKQFYFSAVV